MTACPRRSITWARPLSGVGLPTESSDSITICGLGSEIRFDIFPAPDRPCGAARAGELPVRRGGRCHDMQHYGMKVV